MATYTQIKVYIRNHTGVAVKDCWIAHVKDMHGLTLRAAHNRKDPSIRERPCPDEHIAKIEDAFRHFGMI